MTRNLIYTLVICCLALPGLMRAQNTLPPDAQKAFDLGSAAADQKQWDLAIRYFNEAQKLAPKNPRVLFNLGLAHDKAGHALTGMVWLHAYLAASPKAANAEAVNKEIARLQIANDTTVAKLIQQAIDASRLLTPPSPVTQDWYNTAYWIQTSFPEAFASSGDIESAVKIYDRAKDSNGIRLSNLWGSYLISRASAGDVQAALDGLNHAPLLPENPFNSMVREVIYNYQLEMGDWDGANTTVDQFLQLGQNYSHEDVDKLRKAEPERRNWNALDKWLGLSSDMKQSNFGCPEDLDLEAALRNVDIPPTYFKGDATKWREQAGIAKNLLKIASDLESCSEQIQRTERSLAWQANHPLAK